MMATRTRAKIMRTEGRELILIRLRPTAFPDP